MVCASRMQNYSRIITGNPYRRLMLSAFCWKLRLIKQDVGPGGQSHFGKVAALLELGRNVVPDKWLSPRPEMLQTREAADLLLAGKVNSNRLEVIIRIA